MVRRGSIRQIEWIRPALVAVVVAIPRMGVTADAQPTGVTAPVATVECTDRNGWLLGCKLISENPEGQGVGAAALNLSACMITNSVGAAPKPGMPQPKPRVVSIPFRFDKTSLPIPPGQAKCPYDPATPAEPVDDPSKFVLKRIPSGNDSMDTYPRGAMEKLIAGKVMVECVAHGDSLDACAVLRESPLGDGFDQAALWMMKLFRIAPNDKAGKPVEGRKYRTILNWRTVVLG